MLNTVFPLKAPILADIKGTDQKFPINRIFCVGRNYLAHASEMGVVVDKNTQEPFYFLKDASTYIPSGSTINYPPKTNNYHHEMEFVVAIGKEGFNVPASEADNIIFGYACGLDMTRRDLQLKARESGRPWDLGKNFEQSAVLSEITPVSQSGIITDGVLELKVNNHIVQKSSLSLLIWNVREIIAHLSQFYHLQPGDLIYTGTPEGVGPVHSGDKLEGYIENLGSIQLNIA
ncbi:2-keto-4-pentenoate hydratase/2-oxohepta-3-ene-1,7-dioic acid hydratase (catechol pathway) [Gallibacterium anatis]|uniref:2-keto-4-pentenoate hydratase/2-oxohepta-3-ene-1,7-dioic acid hydratase (Catechol pathway) n=1 Tax=Gallibacterium anatis TaxID=750 RepID=A0A377H3N3_9PAST|nr:fumarylacetoacetate hydrolase family protein [Gallibacterium anatis]KGQ53888.1 fumarylacetoacetase [Gallibacterium anatis DSM 16844 = F 149]STO37173.1 2-keto-4-pentenoate hydratase/2-oxohepta-3-ene-1,7-dioic acid hydratase (catechol pathway) [Gallibacterium anatis]